MATQMQDDFDISPESDGDYFIEAVDKSTFTLDKISPFRHNYHQHPLFQMDNLAALAKRLAVTDQCRFIKRATKINSLFDHSKENLDGWSIDEVFQRIEEPGSWIAFYSVQTDTMYNKFIWEMMASAKHLIPNYEEIFDVRAYLFISAPPSVTPFHIDNENNFWLQVHGRKTLNVWDRDDPEIIPSDVVETFIVHGGDLEKVIFREEKMSNSFEFDSVAGDGVYFPSTTPHMTRSDTTWVKSGDAVAVSIGLTFYTKKTRKEAYVHSCNNFLRRFPGSQPVPPRQSSTLDTLKYPLGRLIVTLKHHLRNYKLPTGF